MEKPVPLAVASEMVTVVPPVLVKVSGWLLLAPTWTFPKAMLGALAVSCPGPIPTPVRLRVVRLVFRPAVDTNAILPVKFPEPLGAKVIANEVDAPPRSTSGNVRLPSENAAPLSVAEAMVRSVPPLLARVTVLVWLAPTLVLPNTTGEGLRTSSPRVAAMPEAARET